MLKEQSDNYDKIRKEGESYGMVLGKKVYLHPDLPQKEWIEAVKSLAKISSFTRNIDKKYGVNNPLLATTAYKMIIRMNDEAEKAVSRYKDKLKIAIRKGAKKK